MFSSTQDFFKKSFAASKRGNPKLTVNSYAKRIGVGVSSLKMILSGKRKPTLHQVLSLSRSQRFSYQQTSFLETMALKEMATTAWEKNYYANALKLKSKEIKLNPIPTSEQDLLLDPLSLPILVDLMDSSTGTINEEKMAKRFGTSTNHIKSLVSKLASNEILQHKKDGDFHVAFDKINHRHLQKKYIKNSLVEASRHVDSDYDNPAAFFTTYTFSTKEADLLQLQMDLKNLMEKYMSEQPYSSSQPREIAQASFQIFQVTKV
ncbi:MAG: helix-turn-helix domain-containing protein [Pseudobdellovibrionaceae bacterium]